VGFDWKTSDERQSSRRSIYISVMRNVAVPELEVMGIPDASSSTDRRTVATTALQSLMLLNSKFTNEHAKYFAARVRREAGEDAPAQISHAFELALCRPPRTDELSAAIGFIKSQAQFAPGKRADKGIEDSALASLCLVLLNTNEFVYTN
jgi:hypothetical protein